MNWKFYTDKKGRVVSKFMRSCAMRGRSTGDRFYLDCAIALRESAAKVQPLEWFAWGGPK